MQLNHSHIQYPKTPLFPISAYKSDYARTSAKVQSNHRKHENFMAKRHIIMRNTTVTESMQAHNF